VSTPGEGEDRCGGISSVAVDTVLPEEVAVGRRRTGRARGIGVRGWMLLLVIAIVAAGVLAGLADRWGS
jgi:hypothetical protein